MEVFARVSYEDCSHMGQDCSGVYWHSRLFCFCTHDRSRTLSENERIQDECSYRICSTQSYITPLGLSCGCSRCSESTSFSGTCSCTRWVLHGPGDMAPGMGR